MSQRPTDGAVSAAPLTIPAAPVPESLEALATRINRAHAEAQQYAAKAVERAYEAGDMLNEAKARVEHGGWLPWLKEHCPDISTRTAQNYMRVARETPPEKRNAAHLSLRGALQAITAEEAPEEAASAKLDEWIEARVSGGDFITETIMLMDADGQSVPDIAARLKLSECYVQAALMPVAPKRAKACKRSSSDKAEIDIEGANAEDLYHDTLSWELHQYRLRTTRMAATLAASEIIERPDLASILNHSIKSITREAVTKPREAVTIKDRGAKAAAFFDSLHAIEGETPFDRWALPLWAWVGVLLPVVITDEAQQHKLGRAWWLASNVIDPRPRNMAREVERLDWVCAAEVLVHFMANACVRERAKEVQG